MNCTWCDVVFINDEKIIIRASEHRNQELFIKQYKNVKEAVTDFKKICDGALPVTENWEFEKEGFIIETFPFFTIIIYDDLKRWITHHENGIKQTGKMGIEFMEYLKCAMK